MRGRNRGENNENKEEARSGKLVAKKICSGWRV